MMSHYTEISDLVSLGLGEEVKKWVVEEQKEQEKRKQEGRSRTKFEDDCILEAVFEAITRNDLPILKSLVKTGISLDSIDDIGRTPLSYAKNNGFNELFNYIDNILQQPIASKTTSKYGQNPHLLLGEKNNSFKKSTAQVDKIHDDQDKQRCVLQ